MENTAATTRTVVRHRCPAAHRRNPAQDPVGAGCVDRCMVATEHAVHVSKKRGEDADVVRWAARPGGMVVSMTVEPRHSVKVA